MTLIKQTRFNDNNNYYNKNNNNNNNIKYYSLSHDVTCDVNRGVSTAYCQFSSGDKVDWLRIILKNTMLRCDCCIMILAAPVYRCSLGGPLSHSSPVVVLFDRGRPCSWNFNSTIPVDNTPVSLHFVNIKNSHKVNKKLKVRIAIVLEIHILHVKQ